MAVPVLIINEHDYAPYVEALEMSKNDLDADGSGRDTQTGLMYRTRVAVKLKAEVRFLRLTQARMARLLADVSGVYYTATLVDPATGERVTKTFYTSAIPFGAQRYDRYSGEIYYSGVHFTMTER